MMYAVLIAAALLSPLTVGVAQAQSDPGKKACVAEARRLCPMEMKSMSRKKVESCMIQKIDQTSPTCHAAMLRIKAEREAGATRR
ncbi:MULTISPECIES: hypothetical protein [Sphingomonas]|jgi:hypothetical protein|uniref:hypothetical protein n=1 Tax=Sphingomonas TaxID=13687 RepID=UPI000B79B00C|nr:hypothetical protein [Sphingomonas sp. Sph1(2015)]